MAAEPAHTATLPAPPQSGIRDNRQRGTAGGFLQDHLQPGSDLSIVSAYFTIHAYRALQEELHQIASLRFLFGEPSFVGDLGQRKNRSKAFQLTDERLVLSTQLAQSSVARECSEWIALDKVEIRSITRSDLLHGKMYHMQKDRGTHALLGSSNFTLSGLGLASGGGNVELNLVVDSDRDRQDLRNWFNEWWNDGDLTMDVKDEVLRELARIYSDQAPQFIYYLTLFHLFRDLIDGDADDQTQLKDLKLPDTHIWQMLYSFQKDGAKAIINRLNDLNGCILADSVGLGKTFTALAVIKYFELRNARVLVLCPKKLRHNWTYHKGHYEHNPLADDHFRYDVLSHTDLGRDKGEVGDLQLDRLNWENYDLLVIDESHNFRNNNYATDEGKQTRYETLINKVIRAGIRTKVLLLSATPVNNALADLRNQISFIAGGDVSKRDDADQAFFERLGIASVADTTRTAQGKFTNWAKQPPQDRKVEDLLQELNGDFFNLLDGLTIARSRRQLKHGYAAEVKELGSFPTREKPKSIHPPLDTQDDTLSFEAIDSRINGLTLALYNPTNFLKKDLDSKTLAFYSDRQFSGFTQQGRERILVGMMKIGFLKRLESSVHSFCLTLGRTIGKIDSLQQKFAAFEQHQAAHPGLDDDAISPEALDAEDEDFLVGGKRKFRLADIDIPRWRQAVVEERERLQALLDAVSAVDVGRDAKLALLRERITGKLQKPTKDKEGRANHKVLVFTAYADTAEYLYEHLHRHIQEQGHHVAMVRGDGNNHSTIPGVRDFETVLTHFSPLARAHKDIPKEQHIDVLIATDCISEGQNLQDCDLLINYDIHWNPVRIIQRFGRIDRIGSHNKAVHLVNFWPMQDLDRYLNLKHRVEARMALADIAATQSDNLLEEDQIDDLVQGELQFRSRQLKRLQNEILDLEDLDETSLSLSDFSLEEFRRDLLEFLESRREELEAAPLGVYAVAPAGGPDSLAQPGAIFCLRWRSQDDQLAPNQPERTVTAINPLHPHHLVYVRDDGTVRLTFVQPKQALTLFREVTAGHTEAVERLCRFFDQKTGNGADMSHYDGLVTKAVQSIQHTFGKQALKNLASDPRGKLPSESQAPTVDSTQYELVTWLSILAPTDDRGNDA